MKDGKGTPVSGVTPAANAAKPAARNGKITLTKNDLANMRKFGLDPTNKEHLREFAVQTRNINETEA